MKKIIWAGAFLLSIAITSCGGGNEGASNISPAFDAAKNNEGPAKVADLLTENDIDCSQLSTEEYAKLGLCLLYVNQNDSSASKQELSKLKDLTNSFDKAGESMSPEALKAAQDAALSLVGE